ncbi:hypothetical protein MANES_06G114000v8 [Manihot esculenta]|uniref:Uncharacterized protein n=1 Tax=Manihot esculenta TaxID=3983 RepID=A0A251KPY6_MANES|nr:hypothetical protein MANES_06G114000v8 [Manihot esculenta]
MKYASCFLPSQIFIGGDNHFTSFKHEPDGWVILAEFETLCLLNTYAPNHGWKEEENSFQRRRKWHRRMLKFVVQLSDEPLIWCGDLMVSRERMEIDYSMVLKDRIISCKVHGQGIELQGSSFFPFPLCRANSLYWGIEVREPFYLPFNELSK